MRLHTRWSTALLCAGLVSAAACDDTPPTLAPTPHLSVTAPAPAPSGLVAFYSFDQNAGNGDIWQATHRPSGGYEGGAYHFNGRGAYIDLPVNVNPSAMPRMTMGAWVRADSIPDDGRSAQVLSHDDGGFDRSIAIDPRGPVNGSFVRSSEGGGAPMMADVESLWPYRFGAFTGDGVTGGADAVTERWVFVAAVYDGASVTMYVDGVPFAAEGTPGEGVDSLRVGGNPAGSYSGEPFHGTIDNVFVYDRALSPDEVEQIRAGGACAIQGTCPPRRMAFYPFDTGAGDGRIEQAVLQSTAGYQGGAYFFDGRDDYIDLPVNVNPAAMPRMTMGAWVRAASPPPHYAPAQVLSHDDGGYDRSLALDPRQPDGAMGLDPEHYFSAFTGSGVLPGPRITIGTWVFVAAVYDGQSVTLYVDGERYTAPARPGSGVDWLRVGGNPRGSPSGEPFHGWIDNVFVVNAALTPGEIQAIRLEGACMLAGTSCDTPLVMDAGGPYTGTEGSPVALALSASDADGDPFDLRWDLGDGTTGPGAPPASHVYADNGTYNVFLVADDRSGLTAEATSTVHVTNVRPQLAPLAGATIVLGEDYTVAISFTDPGADSWTATVDFGDGSPVQTVPLAGRSAGVSHAYAAPGTYTVQVGVRDDDDPTPSLAAATVVVAGLRDATLHVADLVTEAANSGALTDKQADDVMRHLRAAASFLAKADGAAVDQQEIAMLQNALRDVEAALASLPQTGSAVWEVRAELYRVRELLWLRLGYSF